MAGLNFMSALDVKAEDVKPVPVPPAGHYVFQVTKPGVINDGEVWQSVRFSCQAVSVFEDANDVDPDDLKAFGKVTSIMNDKSFMFNKQDGTETDLIRFMNDVKRFCADHLQIEGAEKMTLRELMAKSANKRFVGQLNLKPAKNNPEQLMANIGKTAPVNA